MRPEVRAYIESWACRQIQTFLDELANGTTNYRSLHSLTQQIEHQYHGRFLVELLQNAHDALKLDDCPLSQGRVELRYVPNDGGFGTLYVANDGRAFTARDFETLAMLGQSDKDPNKCVGNKGIGFRSVLEVCRSPEIYSCDGTGRGRFDGYCFRFDADFSRTLLSTIRSLLTAPPVPAAPQELPYGFVDWTAERLNRFRARWGAEGGASVEAELAFLSPYLFPLPVAPTHQIVNSFADQGFATVVRLQLDDDQARDLILKKLEEIHEEDILFLDALRSLTIHTGDSRTTISRASRLRGDELSGEEVTICPSSGVSAGRRFWIWSRDVGGEKDPQGALRLAAAARNLPGKWPELRSATVSVAIAVEGPPAVGRYAILLPTALPTGIAAHLNAPFFGDMSRTGIAFPERLNDLLLGELTVLISEVILKVLPGRGPREAAAILDLVAPASDSQAEGPDLSDRILQRCQQIGCPLDHAALILTDQGWKPLGEVRLLPILPLAVLSADRLRAAAAFPVPSVELDGRRGALQKLAHRLGSRITPSTDELAATVERAAHSLFRTGSQASDWDGFWSDVMQLLPTRFGQRHPLLQRRVVLGSDGRLHAPGSMEREPRVFFPPVGREDDTSVQTGTITEVPRTLRKHVAFLNIAITIRAHGERGRVELTPVRRYLGSGDPPLVHEYRADQIYTQVLIPKTPRQIVPHDSKLASRCRDILHWAVDLIGAARETSTLLPLLGKLRLPCRDGWYLATEVPFGPGWPDTAGDSLATYLSEVQTQDRALTGRLLVPPDDAVWPRTGKLLEWLKQACVMDGLRTVAISEADWKPDFEVRPWTSPRFPSAPPPGVPADIWEQYAVEVGATAKAHFQSVFAYRLEDLRIFVGLEHFHKLSDPAREALMLALFASLPAWDTGWSTSRARKIYGQSDVQTVESFLHFALRTLPWLVIKPQPGAAHEFAPPPSHWYVPSPAFAGGRHQYAHLDCLPPDLALELERRQGLIDALADLGLPCFPMVERSSNTRFLNALAFALREDRVSTGNRDVFIAHVRRGWECFWPAESANFPTEVIVRRGGQSLDVVGVDSGNTLYLRDAPVDTAESLSDPGIAVVEIEPSDARRLLEAFRRHIGVRIRPISALSPRVMVDNAPWKEDGSETSLLESDLKWLPIFSLTIAAYHGERSHGTHTKRFREAVGRFRGAKVENTGPLAVELRWEEELVATRTVGAFWVRQAGVLLVDRSADSWVEALAEPLASVLERDDLLIPLRLALSKLDTTPFPSCKELVRALQSLGLDESHLGDIEQHWMGDLQWAIARLRPALRLLASQFDLGILDRLQSENELRELLKCAITAEPGAGELLNAARGCESDEMMGRWLYERLGSLADLAEWNRVLEELGPPYGPIVSERANEDVANHLEEAKLSLYAILRRAARDTGRPEFYLECTKRLQSLGTPPELAKRCWHIDFGMIMQMVVPLLEEFGAGARELETVRTSTSPESLALGLKALGLDPEQDPAQIYAQNHALCRSTAGRVQRAALVWLARRGLGLGAWEQDPEVLAKPVLDRLAKGAGFLEVFTADRAFREVARLLPREEEHGALWELVDGSDTVEDLLGRLELSREDLESVTSVIEHQREARQRSERTVPVCGGEFYATSRTWISFGTILGLASPTSMYRVSLPPIPRPLTVFSAAGLEPVRNRAAKAGQKDRGRRTGGKGSSVLPVRSMRSACCNERLVPPWSRLRTGCPRTAATVSRITRQMTAWDTTSTFEPIGRRTTSRLKPRKATKRSLRWALAR